MTIDELEAALWSEDPTEAAAAVDATPPTPDPEVATRFEARLRKRAPALLVKPILLAIGRVGSRAQEGVLMRFVGSPNVEVRQTAVAALLKVSETAGLRAVVELSTADPHPCLRACSLQFLRGRSREVLASLLDDMRREPDTWMFRAALRCSAALKCTSAAPVQGSPSFEDLWTSMYVPPVRKGTDDEKPWFYEGEVGIDGLFDESPTGCDGDISFSEVVVIEVGEERESGSSDGQDQPQIHPGQDPHKAE